MRLNSTKTAENLLVGFDLHYLPYFLKALAPGVYPSYRYIMRSTERETVPAVGTKMVVDIPPLDKRIAVYLAHLGLGREALNAPRAPTFNQK